MRVQRKYKQLKFCLDALKAEYHSVSIGFKLHNKEVRGILNGNPQDWKFHSTSPVFLKYIPSGTLSKYALWLNGVPKVISPLYVNIIEAAAKAGYDLCEREELA
jgi:hypothetical protein